MLGFDGEYPACHSKAKIRCFGKKMQKISSKTIPIKTYFT